MSEFPVETVRSRAQTALALAGLLERLEHSPSRVDAAQYQTVVARLKSALAEPLPTAVLDAVLSGHRAATELYENLHYAQAGLSRASLDDSVASERLATEWLAHAAHSSRN